MSEAFGFQLLPVALALIPLVIAPGLMFYFDITPKIVVLLIATGVALFYSRTNMCGLRVLRSCRTARWFVHLLIAQVTAILVGTIFSDDLALSIVGGAWRRSGAVVEIATCVFVLLIAARFASSRGTIEVTLKLVAVSCLLTAIYGIAQFFGVDPFLPVAPYHAGEGIWTIVRPPSTLGNANFFATYLLYAALASMALIRKEFTVWTVISAAASGLGMIAIVLSGTRSGILGLLVALAVLVAGFNRRLRIWTIGGVVCAAILITILATTPLGLPLKARVRWSREDGLGGGRIVLWRDTLRMFAHRPLAGFGSDTFTREFPAFQSVELSRLHPGFYQESPHNALLDAAVNMGALGLAASLAMLVFGFYAAWQVRTKNPRLALCLTAALAGGAISAQFSPPVLVTRLYAMTLTAILCAAGCRRLEAQPEPARFAKVAYAFSGAILLLFAASLGASDLLAGCFKRSVEAGNIDAAVARYRRVRDYAIPGFTVDLYASRSLSQLASTNAPLLTRALAWRTALESGNRAIRTAEDRQNALLNMAQLYSRQNDAARTEENLRMASEAAPNWFKPHWILAELLLRTGRIPEAREQARIAWNLDAGKDVEVVRTWQSLGSPR